MTRLGVLTAEPGLPVWNRWRRGRAVAAIIVCVFAMAGDLWAVTLSPVVGVALIGGIAYLQCMLSWVAFIVYGRTGDGLVRGYALRILRFTPLLLLMVVGMIVWCVSIMSMSHDAAWISAAVLWVSGVVASQAGMVD